jgi:hypothetical protein
MLKIRHGSDELVSDGIARMGFDVLATTGQEGD